MQNTRIILTLLAIGIIAGQIIILDFSDLSWKSNAGSYLSILSMIMLLVAMILSYREERKKE